MNKISINSLPEGKYISEPVYLDEKYILLSPDVEVTSELKTILKKWEYKFVYSNGSPQDTPPATTGAGQAGLGAGDTADPLAGDKPLKEQEKERETLEFFNETVLFMEKYFNTFKEDNALPITRISDKVKEIVTFLKDHRGYLINVKGENDESPDSYLSIHSVKSAILSLAIGEYIKLPPHKLIELGIAALLHELGMMRIPPNIYRSNKKLSDKEKQIIKTHPVISYKALKEAEYPSPIFLAVLEHHEYVNGSGYPRGVTGDKISLYGKIIGVASAYSAATSKREYRDSKDGHSGIMDLLQGKGIKYDENVLRALVYIISVYPMGTYVLLNNGAKGVVIKTNLETPKNPILKLLTDENGTPYNRKPILQTHPEDEIQVARTLSKEEIAEVKALFR